MSRCILKGCDHAWSEPRAAIASVRICACCDARDVFVEMPAQITNHKTEVDRKAASDNLRGHKILGIDEVW